MREMQSVLRQYDTELQLLRSKIQLRLSSGDFPDDNFEASWHDMLHNIDVIAEDLSRYHSNVSKELLIISKGYERLDALSESKGKQAFREHMSESLVFTVRQTRIGCYDFDETMQSLARVQELLERNY